MYTKYNYKQLGSLIGLSAIAVLTAVCLYSYHATDQSLLYYCTTLHKHHNYLGFWGASWAAYLLLYVGDASLLIPFLLGYLVYQKLFRKRWLITSLQVVGWCQALALISVLQAYKLIYILAAKLPGGLLGQSLVIWCYKLKDPILVNLFFIVSTFMVLLLSFDTLLPSCGHQLMWLIQRAGGWKIVYYCTLYPLQLVYSSAKNIYTLLSGQWIEKLPGGIISFENLYSLEGIFTESTPAPDKTLINYHEDMPPLGLVHSPLITDDVITATVQTFNEKIEPTHPVVQNYSLHEKPLKPQAIQKNYILPLTTIFPQATLLDTASGDDKGVERASRLELKLQRFGIEGKVVAITPGPVITFFEYEPQIDAKVSRIVALEDDLALALEALSVRIIAPVPGRCVVGFEVANKVRHMVLFADIVRSAEFTKSTEVLGLALGCDVKGAPVIVDLASMPHLLIAGTTGSGKSGVLNTILMSILCKQSPDKTKLILIDPKRLEFSVYAGIPHLLFPIVTDVKKVAAVLQWVLQEMYERYERMEKVGVRNMIEYNHYAAQNNLEAMSSLIVMIDELADIMLSVGKEVEQLIVRIAQMARAASIHLIIATQRPSVDVITGLIKGNFPSRIACRVASKIDSRTILDANGAHKLLGKGDMLLLTATEGLKRVHGAYVSMQEINQLVIYLKRFGQPQYINMADPDQQAKINKMHEDHDTGNNDEDSLYPEVLKFIATTPNLSVSLLQRRFRIGYNRSARLVEKLEAEGIIMYDAMGKIKKVVEH